MNPESHSHSRLDDATPYDDWAEPIPLFDELPTVAPFSEELLPTELRPWVMDIAERMSCPADLVAMPAMIAIGSLVGARCLIRPQEMTTWAEPGNLWGGGSCSARQFENPRGYRGTKAFAAARGKSS